jgi:hypothetical protein
LWTSIRGTEIPTGSFKKETPSKIPNFNNVLNGNLLVSFERNVKYSALYAAAHSRYLVAVTSLLEYKDLF